MRSPAAISVVVAVLVACSPGSERPGDDGIPAPSGPPVVQHDLVDRHARQFDDEVPNRPPGSQHEVAAASYILGHLQLAGYSPRLDGVPVAHQVRSTNVVAMPPEGSDPEYLVVVAYDTRPGGGDGAGRYIGLFLELARALHVADPHHGVGFVAVGAESAGNRGTRRLARFLLDEGLDPSVISIGLDLEPADDALTEAGFEHEALSGPARGLGADLFELLT